MSYYMGADTDKVKPITRRKTWTRGKFPRRTAKFLMQPGRKPKNRRGFPVGSKPVAVFGRSAPLKMDRPGITAAETEEALWLGTPLPVDMSLEPGQQLGGLFDAFKVPTLTSSYTPGPATSMVTAPASSWWNPVTAVTSAVQLWKDRPEALQDISIRFNPLKAVQGVVSPGQLESAVDKLRRLGIDPTYKGMPLTGQQAGWGYRLAGIDWASYLPWIIGGGALLFVVPMLMKKR